MNHIQYIKKLVFAAIILLLACRVVCGQVSAQEVEVTEKTQKYFVSFDEQDSCCLEGGEQVLSGILSRIVKKHNVGYKLVIFSGGSVFDWHGFSANVAVLPRLVAPRLHCVFHPLKIPDGDDCCPC